MFPAAVAVADESSLLALYWLKVKRTTSTRMMRGMVAWDNMVVAIFRYVRSNTAMTVVKIS